MAEAGIKISELTLVNPKQDGSDYTVLVQNGVTRRTYISSINDLASDGAIVNLDKIKTNLEALSSYTHSLSTNENIKDAFTRTYEAIETVQLAFNEANNGLSDEIYLNSLNIERISSSLDSLNVLISDPEMLSSLTSMISLLSGDDGQTSLSNIANSIIAISSDLEEAKNKLNDSLATIVPALNATTETVDSMLKDSFYSKPLNGENNSAVLLESNESYDFSYDKRRFANNDGAMIEYLSAELSGVVNNSSPTTTSRVVTTDIPTIDDLTSNYFDPNANVYAGLSNVSIISAEGISCIGSDFYLISTFYNTTVDYDAEFIDIVESSTEVGEAEEFPGESTFSIDMVPIRAGMLDFSDGQNGVLKLEISGNSDVGLYYANEAEIIEGYRCKVKIEIETDDESETIAKRLGSGKQASDFDLGVVFYRQVKGGSIVSFSIALLLKTPFYWKILAALR